MAVKKQKALTLTLLDPASKQLPHTHLVKKHPGDFKERFKIAHERFEIANGAVTVSFCPLSHFAPNYIQTRTIYP